MAKCTNFTGLTLEQLLVLLISLVPIPCETWSADWGFGFISDSFEGFISDRKIVGTIWTPGQAKQT